MSSQKKYYGFLRLHDWGGGGLHFWHFWKNMKKNFFFFVFFIKFIKFFINIYKIFSFDRHHVKWWPLAWFLTKKSIGKERASGIDFVFFLKKTRFLSILFFLFFLFFSKNDVMIFINFYNSIIKFYKIFFRHFFLFFYHKIFIKIYKKFIKIL